MCKLRTEIHFYIFKLYDTLTLKLDNDFKFQTWIFVKALIVDYENYVFWSLLIFTRCPRRVKTYFVELREKMEAGQIRMWLKALQVLQVSLPNEVMCSPVYSHPSRPADAERRWCPLFKGVSSHSFLPCILNSFGRQWVKYSAENYF